MTRLADGAVLTSSFDFLFGIAEVEMSVRNDSSCAAPTSRETLVGGREPRCEDFAVV